MAMKFSPLDWATFGPFAVQTCRIFHYALYFVAGVATGASGANQGLLAVGGRLARRWAVWMGMTVLCFLIAGVLVVLAMTRPGALLLSVAGGVAFALSCAASSFGLLALFLRWSRRSTALDNVRDNAYGIYLVHYAAVTWLQYALLRAILPGTVKGSVVFVGAVALSWGVSAAMRRLPAIRRLV
jgi:hypothetical protein